MLTLVYLAEFACSAKPVVSAAAATEALLACVGMCTVQLEERSDRMLEEIDDFTQGWHQPKAHRYSLGSNQLKPSF